MFLKYSSLDAKDLQDVFDILSLKKVKKGSFLCKSGQVYSQEILLVKGVIRASISGEQGETTRDFWKGPELCLPCQARI